MLCSFKLMSDGLVRLSAFWKVVDLATFCGASGSDRPNYKHTRDVTRDVTHMLVSQLLQVLVSTQSLILVDEPYFNEPGYEVSALTSY